MLREVGPVELAICGGPNPNHPMTSKFERSTKRPQLFIHNQSQTMHPQISKADAARLPARRVRRPLDLVPQRLLRAGDVRLPLPHAHHGRRQAALLRVQGEVNTEL